MTEYLVVGVYHSTGEVYATHIMADGPHEAIRIFAGGVDIPDDLEIVGAIETAADIVAACEESGKAAYAIDLMNI